MNLDSESLHSPSLQEVLEDIEKSLPENGGILMQDFTEEDVHLLYELGFNLYQVGDYKKGEEIFKRLVIACPLEKNHWRGLGSCLQMQQKYEEALVSWSMCTIVDPQNPLPHFHAAECLFSLDQLDDALQALKAAENRDNEKTFVGKISALKQTWSIYD